MSKGESLEHILAKAINLIIQFDVQTENARIKLAKDPNLNLYSLYRSIDRSGNGFITPQDLGMFLSASGMNLEESVIIATFFSKGNKDNVYKISYHNFMNQLLPNSDLELRKHCMGKSNDRTVNPQENIRKQIEREAAAIYNLLVEQTKQLRQAFPLNCQPTDFTKIIYSLCDNATGYFCYKK